MNRSFNTAGPNVPSDHYTLDPFGRIDWPQLRRLIDGNRYFVLHAPRQTGKTTLLNAIVKQINVEGKYEALYFNVEDSRVARNDYHTGNREIASTIILSARVAYPDGWLAQEGRQYAAVCEPGTLLKSLLTEWTIRANKRTVLLIDEVDSLIGDTLVSVLHQLRAGYNARPLAFPQSVILCGVRDVRDYRIQTSEGRSITGGSCFNIKTKSLRLGCFSDKEVRELYLQHTKETGQAFADHVFPKLMSLTGGQPWLVNAIANELTEEMPELLDRSRGIGLDDLDEAKERLILRRDTHLDHLLHKLEEDRVRRTIAPILAGAHWGDTVPPDDLQYVVDLGLVVISGDSGARIANDIYQEIIPRELTFMAQQSLAAEVPRQGFLLSDGRLDFRGIISGFQQFYRENSEAWKKRVTYEEAAPQLLLQAWLQRIVNGGGHLVREYALGSGRADILVRHFFQDAGKRAEQRFVVEIKVVGSHHSVKTTIDEALVQIARYADKCGPEESHLVVVNPKKLSWTDKLYVKECSVDGRAITVWGM